MPFELHRSGYPGIAASRIADAVPSGVQRRVAVAQAAGIDRGFVPIATSNVRPFGVNVAPASAVGAGVAVLDEGNTVVVTAAASLGRGAEIGVASSNGAFGPVAGASGSIVYSVGQSVTAAAAGEDFSLDVNPRQLSGLV